jgi:hypothetical protein
MLLSRETEDFDSLIKDAIVNADMKKVILYAQANREVFDTWWRDCIMVDGYSRIEPWTRRVNNYSKHIAHSDIKIKYPRFENNGAQCSYRFSYMSGNNRLGYIIIRNDHTQPIIWNLMGKDTTWE